MIFCGGYSENTTRNDSTGDLQLKKFLRKTFQQFQPLIGPFVSICWVSACGDVPLTNMRLAVRMLPRVFQAGYSHIVIVPILSQHCRGAWFSTEDTISGSGGPPTGPWPQLQRGAWCPASDWFWIMMGRMDRCDMVWLIAILWFYDFYVHKYIATFE